MLTKEQKRRLAKEARKLSLRIAAKGPPGTLYASDWCGCGIGHVMQEAGFRPEDAWGDPVLRLQRGEPTISYGDFCGVAHGIDDLVDRIISEATVREKTGEHGSLVFPLLYLADVLEESARK